MLQGNLRAMLDGVYSLEHGEIATPYDETRLLNRLVDDLRELALGEAGRLKLNLQSIDLAALIGSTATNFMPVAEERGLMLVAKIDRTIEVRADPDRVAQVLRNLSANALWHTPPQGHLAVEAQPIDQGWRINGADTGAYAQQLLQSKQITPRVGQVFLLTRAQQAQELSHTGHGRGRIVLHCA